MHSRFFEITVTTLIVLSAGLCIFTPETAFFQRGADFTAHIMLAFLFLGMFFLVYGQQRLMFISLATCLGLCLFLKEASNSSLSFPEKNAEPEISVIHVNVSAIESGHEEFFEQIKAYNADVISFQEVTPDWDMALRNALSDDYPYVSTVVRIDPFGMAVYSKVAVIETDTFYYKDIPNLLMELALPGDKKVCVLSTYVLPPLNTKAGLETKQHLHRISEEINRLDKPAIAVGDFNMVYWANEIRTFRNAANLENSRRDISHSGLKVPYDHIFFSPEVECTAFGEINDASARHLGIIGSYQFKKLRKPERSTLTSRMGFGR